jgi:hypothetical protein
MNTRGELLTRRSVPTLLGAQRSVLKGDQTGSPSDKGVSGCVGGGAYGDVKVANRDTKVWHGARGNGP